MSKHLKLAKAVLGDEIYEVLHKAIVKLPTKTVVDITETHDALKMAPKSVMSFIMKITKNMADKEAKEISVPFGDKVDMLINKLTSDQYSGCFYKDGQIIHEFHNTSIPQLSSHILSLFELYDESPASALSQKEIEKEKTKKEKNDDESTSSMKQHIEKLEEKINQLFALAANNVNKNDDSNKDDKELQKVNDDSDINKNYDLDKIQSYKKILEKAGLAPTMPSPPKPGTKVGGSQGITRGGLHGAKTEHTDANIHPISQRKNPDLKVGKPTAVGKTLTFTKSELNNKCEDCGQSGHCICFRGLSKPEIKKAEDGKVTLHFKEDWDLTSLSVFYRSIKRVRDEQ